MDSSTKKKLLDAEAIARYDPFSSHNNIRVTATYEDGSDFRIGNVYCAVRMYERYSWFGGNRVAMSLTLVGDGDRLHLTAITAGGSQAMFFKLNTVGEESFLDTLAQVVDSL